MSKIVQTPTSIKNRTRKALQRGFSNVQIAIGILVTIILLLGALSGYQYIQQAKVNNEVSTLTDLRAATVRYGQFAAPFTAVNSTLAILSNLNFFESSGFIVTRDGQGAVTGVTNQWGGAIAVAPSADGNSLEFTFNNVPRAACRELGTKVDNIVTAVSIAAVPTKAANASTNPALVATNCAEPSVMIFTIAR